MWDWDQDNEGDEHAEEVKERKKKPLKEITWILDITNFSI